MPISNPSNKTNWCSRYRGPGWQIGAIRKPALCRSLLHSQNEEFEDEGDQGDHIEMKSVNIRGSIFLLSRSSLRRRWRTWGKDDLASGSVTSTGSPRPRSDNSLFLLLFIQIRLYFRACQAFCGSIQSRRQKRGRRKKGKKRRKGRDLKRKRRRKQRKLLKLELIYPPPRANSVDYLISEERPVVVFFFAKCVVCCIRYQYVMGKFIIIKFGLTLSNILDIIKYIILYKKGDTYWSHYKKGDTYWTQWTLKGSN